MSAVRRSPVRLPILVLWVAVEGCGGFGAPAAPESIVPSPAGAPPTATVRPTVAATATAATESVAPPSPTAEVVSFEPIPEPPAALLSVDGGDPVVGELGGYTWQQGGQSAPWLPGNPIHIANGEVLTVALADRVGISRWTASRVRSDNLDGGSIAIGEGSTARIAFPAPPPGDWSVLVRVTFADGLGDAGYFWAVEVD